MNTTNRHNHRWAWALLGLLLALAPAALCAGEGGGEGMEGGDGDVVVMTDNTARPPMKVTEDNYIEVVGVLANRPVKTPAWKVKEVQYADRNQMFITGMEFRQKGLHFTSTKAFELALSSLSGSKWAQDYCNYYMAEGLYHAKDWKGRTSAQNNKTYAPPADYYAKCIAANPKSRFLLDAMVKIGICRAQEGKFSEAQSALDAAEKRIRDYRNQVMNIGAEYFAAANEAEAMLNYGKGVLFENQARENKDDSLYSRALSSFKSAQSGATGKYYRLYADAVDSELRVMIAMDDTTGAQERAKSVIESFRKNPEPNLIPMMPAAYMALGLAHYQDAEKNIKKDRLPQAEFSFSEARWNFLHVIVEYFDDKDHVAKANYYAGRCYEALKDAEFAALTKARRHYDAVVNDFGESAFAQLAQERLKELPAGSTDEVDTTPGEKLQDDADTKKEGEGEKKEEAAPAAKTE